MRNYQTQSRTQQLINAAYYQDHPRPDMTELAVPAGLAVFFGVMAALISMLAVLFLPPPFWLFVAPVLGLCGVGVMLAVRRVRGLRRLVYRIDGGRLTIGQGRAQSYVLLADLDRVAADKMTDLSLIPSLVPTGSGGSARSARGYANRAHGIVYLEAGGEWLRLSPTDPSAFLSALERAIREAKHAENTSPQPSGDESR